MKHFLFMLGVSSSLAYLPSAHAINDEEARGARSLGVPAGGVDAAAHPERDELGDSDHDNALSSSDWDGEDDEDRAQPRKDVYSTLSSDQLDKRRQASETEFQEEKSW